MTARAADPARTHALLVGIERYAEGGDWNLNGPARDVIEFHAWLCSRGVPAKQIGALVSPLDQNLAALEKSGIDFAPATAEGIRAALNALHVASGELLFLFWAGHGVHNDREHRLFTADATTHDKRNYGLESLRASLRSDYFAGFPLQIILVDACNNYQGFAFTFPSEEMPAGQALGHEQFVFLAAREGQVAKNLGEEKRGLFSRELLRQVTSAERSASTWPPDMLAVAKKVQDEFAAMRATGGGLNQTPIYEWSRDWDGNVIKLVLQQPGGPPKRRGWKLDFEQLAALTDALVACEKMALPDGRNDLLAQIRADIAHSVPRRSDAKSDVMNIVRTASGYAGGLEELLRQVRYTEGQGATESWQGVEKALAERLPGLRLAEEADST